MNKIIKKEIKPLNSEIRLVQMEKFINDFDNSMKKDLRSRTKKTLLAILPAILSFIGFLIFKNLIWLVVGSSITGISAIGVLIKDFINDIKIEKNNNKSNTISIVEEKDVEQILQEGIGKKSVEDFYSEKYKSAINRSETYAETEEEKKYKLALQKQQYIAQKNSSLKRISDYTNYLNKDETMEQVLKEVDAYTVAYNLPPLEILNSEWDLFFDTTYDFFNKKGIESEFYDLISQVGRFVFAKAILNKKNKIFIYDFVENLYYLENQKIDKKEIAILQKEMLSKLPRAKIIDFSDQMTEKRRK